jgi:hypothetical protein
MPTRISHSIGKSEISITHVSCGFVDSNVIECLVALIEKGCLSQSESSSVEKIVDSQSCEWRNVNVCAFYLVQYLQISIGPLHM